MNRKAVRRSLVDKLEDMQAIQISAQNSSGLPEYRRAKAETVESAGAGENIASAREVDVQCSQDLVNQQTSDRCNAC